MLSYVQRHRLGFSIASEYPGHKHGHVGQPDWREKPWSHICMQHDAHLGLLSRYSRVVCIFATQRVFAQRTVLWEERGCGNCIMQKNRLLCNFAGILLSTPLVWEHSLLLDEALHTAAVAVGLISLGCNISNMPTITCISRFNQLQRRATNCRLSMRDGASKVTAHKSRAIHSAKMSREQALACAPQSSVPEPQELNST